MEALFRLAPIIFLFNYSPRSPLTWLSATVSSMDRALPTTRHQAELVDIVSLPPLWSSRHYNATGSGGNL